MAMDKSFNYASLSFTPINERIAILSFHVRGNHIQNK